MKKQDIVTILFTFFCGFVAGVYLYFVGFQPQMQKVTSEFIPPPDPAKIITIEGYQYGGCERSGRCASFRVDNDGGYLYRATSLPSTVDPVRGTLLRRDWQTIRNNLTAEELSNSATPYAPELCGSFYDLVDYRYIIQFAGERYELNTCGTALNRESDLGMTLDWLWQFFIADIEAL